ncbi:MAG: hypothetical protein HQK49_19610 [Oligoflexia bacterium]|nr:hypothetical protein [Oligoflexia bacterium]
MKKIYVSFDNKSYPFTFWSPSVGNIGPSSLDTETTMGKEGEIPNLVTEQVFNGIEGYFITRDMADAFMSIHNSSPLYFANAPFDLNVLRKFTNINVFGYLESGNLIDVILLGQLIALAEGGDWIPRLSLDYLAMKYLNVKLEKDVVDKEGQKIRESFGQFLRADGSVLYDEIPVEYLNYAGQDAIATFLITEKLISKSNSLSKKYGVDEKLLLSHNLQLRASYALAQVSFNGMDIDLELKEKVKGQLTQLRNEALEGLKVMGWAPGSGSATKTQQKLAEIETTYSLALPRTPKGKITAKYDDLVEHRHLDPFISGLIDFNEHKKTLDFLKMDSKKIHPKFNPIVSTGRSSSYSPNMQNMPRDNENFKIRSIIKAPEGSVLVSADYSQIELRTLAQITYWKFGYSKMLELINSGVDLHSYFASKITGKPIDQVSSEDRQKAKICNFGLPGGLGLEAFISFAKNNYNLLLSEGEATELKQEWLNTYPEVDLYLKSSSEIEKCTGFLSRFDDRITRGEYSYWVFKGIISGNRTTKTNPRHFTQEEIEWAFTILERTSFPLKHKFTNSIQKREGSFELCSNFMRIFNWVILPSGRIRVNTTYCQSKNNPFQGLAADGAKEALYQLVKNNYPAINFIHDENLIPLSLASDLEFHSENIKKIMVNSMKIYCPDVTIEVDLNFMFRWQKKGTHILKNGILVEKNNN